MTSTAEKRAWGTWDNTPGQGEGYKLVLRLVGHKGEDCVTWPYTLANGYGVFSLYGQLHYAHRYLCELIHGPAPSTDHEATHSCGRGHLGCVNPLHLDWKTHSENQLDRARHGTRSTWSKRGKVSWQQVQEIRALIGTRPQREIAAIFGISRSQISWIATGKSWKKPKGVTPLAHGRWSARIKLNGQDKWLGTFNTEDEARAAYEAAAAEARTIDSTISKGECQ
jgi:hypothetical protein